MSFKVIVVGGGPVGLTAAHALSQAGVDFTVLERREHPVIDAGSNLVLTVIGLRALGQLGLLHSLHEHSATLRGIGRLDHDGENLGDLNWFYHDKEYFGAFPEVLSRHDLTKVLYESLPVEAQDRILGNKKVSGITSTPDGISVSCADGTSYDGTLVIGADGAHSFVRDCMRTLALESGSDQVNDEKPFLTTYRSLWLRFPTTASDEIQPGITTETHGPVAATQLFAAGTTTVVAVYERMDEPTRDRTRYRKEDEVAMVERWGHLPLVPSKNFTLRHGYEQRVESGLVSLEEGLVDHWSWGSRVVLTGDAVHKFTPSTGAGCNNGIIDVVSLANELHKAVASSKNGVPPPHKIEAAFKAYQATRYEVAKETCEQASQVTEAATWGSTMHKIVDRYVLTSNLVQKYVSWQGAEGIQQTPTFNYVPGKELMSGSMPWSNPIPSSFDVGKAF
ncbi:hypothetical protein FDECE_17355 [Fusarium decemcellulare]|nr:hypothetical protein FDECE_17355 [Fusarium decemcellulare]